MFKEFNDVDDIKIQRGKLTLNINVMPFDANNQLGVVASVTDKNGNFITNRDSLRLKEV